MKILLYIFSFIPAVKKHLEYVKELENKIKQMEREANDNDDDD